ncbi:MAG: alpha-L-fucosidase [Puia sp.]|nr:alpha-L-fucosidase [Puia sp.]
MFQTRLTALLLLCLLYRPSAGAQDIHHTVDTSRLRQERARKIHLPATDVHYQQVKDYVEEQPDPDYFHASENAYESFRDMKFGVRIHWGIYAAWQMAHESWGFLELSDAKKQQYQETYKTWNPTGFNADEWMDLFREAGLKCFAFTSKHHDGFSLFDTKTRVRQRVNYLAPGGPAIEDCDLSYSIMEGPFRRDIVKELCESARRHDIRIDLYFSHPDWYDADFRPYNYHPLQTPDAKNNPTNYGDKNSFSDSYSDNRHPSMAPDPTPLQRERMIERHRQQLTELLTNYGKIDMICLDQYFGPTAWPDLKKTIKMARTLQPDVMLRCRGIGNYGDYYTPEGFVPGKKENTNMPWMVIYPLASGFSYDKTDSNYKGSKWIIHNLVDAVSKGGNFMVGIGPDSMGHFHPKAVEQLKETGQWLKINGEGIYATRARKDWKEGTDIRYTTTKDKKYIYAFALDWPGKKLTLKTVKPAKGSEIRLLGYGTALKWQYTGGRLTILIPSALQDEHARPCRSAWAFRIEESPAAVSVANR